MTGDQKLRRRDVLKATGAAGLLGATGMTLTGAAAQEQVRMRTYSYSLQEGDVFRIRFRAYEGQRTPGQTEGNPAGNPATETVPAACLDGEADEEFQLFIVEAYRDEEFIGYRSLLTPSERLAPDVLETTQGTETTEAETETVLGTETGTTEAALQDETTEEETPTEDAETTAVDGETTTVSADDLPEIGFGQWYRVASSEECDGLYRLRLETTEEPETTGGPGTTAAGDETETTEVETETEDEVVETTTEA